jgi:hypothetical protein
MGDRSSIYCSLSDAGRLGKIRLVKTYLKILAAVVSVAILWLCSSYVRYVRDEPVRCDTLTLTGLINADTFVEARDCLVRSAAAKKTFVVKASGGGDGAAAMALGFLIHRHHWDVEVVDVCASACANWIFPAGKTKYLNQHSLLLFHGGPYQENMLEMAEKFDRESAMNGEPVGSVVLGQANKEGTITFSPHRSKADQEVRDFLSIADGSAVEYLGKLKSASDQLYQELGVNPLLSTYGQIGGYEATYKSYKYGGFIYRQDSLRRLGIGDVELKEGEWHPEGHPDYQDVYEVTYP